MNIDIEYLNTIKHKALNKEIINRDECEFILNFPNSEILKLLDAAYAVRKYYVGNTVQIQVLLNAKSGNCSEDCHYCSQSKISKADIKKYSLKKTDEVLKDAINAADQGAIRYCMALSGSKYGDELISQLADIIKTIKKEVNIYTCCSLGFLTEKQAVILKEAGLERVNHNLNTSRNYYGKICTTHSYDDRVQNIKLCRKTGFEVCSGVIIGQGESHDDIIDVLTELKKLQPNAVPINFLVPVEGTPFGTKDIYLKPVDCLKILCLARFIFPSTDIRAAGGRELYLKSLQPLAFYCINSIFVSGYLTIDGQPADEGIQMVEDAGFEIEIEGAAAD